MNLSISLTVTVCGGRRTFRPPRHAARSAARASASDCTKKDATAANAAPARCWSTAGGFNSCLALAVSHVARCFSIEASRAATYCIRCRPPSSPMTACSADSVARPDHERDRLIQEAQAGDDPRARARRHERQPLPLRAYAGITEAVLEAQQTSPRPTRGARMKTSITSDPRPSPMPSRLGRTRMPPISRVVQSARPDEGRRNPAEPSRRCHASARARPHRTYGAWRIRIGAQVRNADLAHDPDFCQLVSRHCRGAVVRRLGAASQCPRPFGWQSPASGRAVDIFTTRQALQQTPAGSGCDGRHGENACTPCSAGARPALPPSVGFLRSRGRTRRVVEI